MRVYKVPLHVQDDESVGYILLITVADRRMKHKKITLPSLNLGSLAARTETDTLLVVVIFRTLVSCCCCCSSCTNQSAGVPQAALFSQAPLPPGCPCCDTTLHKPLPERVLVCVCLPFSVVRGAERERAGPPSSFYSHVQDESKSSRGRPSSSL